MILEEEIKQIPRNITTFGGIEFQLAMLISFFLLGFDLLALRLFIGLLATYTIASFIRLLFFRERPVKRVYNNFVDKIVAGSFPSGHSMNVSFLAIILIQYFNNIGFSIFVLLLAISVGLSRIYLKRHHKSDVLGGSVFGIVVALLILEFV
jgi:undecaprenyl-diphosphatase